MAKKGTDSRPFWQRRSEKMKREGRCVTCGVDRGIAQAYRDDPAGTLKRLLDEVGAEVEETKDEVEVAAEVDESAGIGDGLDGRVGEETPTVAETIVEQTEVKPKARKRSKAKAAKA